jgi:methylated-DNA-[protein]-cysteine S-methyltransferase
MTQIFWDMILCQHGPVAVVAKGNSLIRVCFERSAEDITSIINRLQPGAEHMSTPMITDWLRQLIEYFDGQRRSFQMQLENDNLSTFAKNVHQELINVPYGQVVTYGELAVRAGSPRAARAVGRVMSSNPFPLIVPCHRVVNTGGRIGNYSAAHGSTTKAWLLDFEKNNSIKL